MLLFWQHWFKAIGDTDYCQRQGRVSELKNIKMYCTAKNKKLYAYIKKENT